MTAPMPIASLVTHWRAQAAQYERDGVTLSARMLTRCAEELEAALRESQDALVNVNEAARRSGYAPDTLSRMVRDGTLPNYGRKHAPRLRVADLPLRPSRTRLASTARHRSAVAEGTGVTHATND